MLTGELLVQSLVQGILQGGVYALVGTGMALILRVTGVLNFAHGGFLMLAMYGTLLAHRYLGLGPHASVAVMFPVFYLLGYGIYRFLIAPIVDAGLLEVAQLCLGLIFVLEGAALIAFTANVQGLEVGAVSPGKLRLGPIFVGLPQLYAFAGAAVMCSALYWVLQTTALGRQIRATAENEEVAQLYGIHTARVKTIVFALGLALLTVAAGLLMPFSFVSPHTGEYYIVITLIVIVLGGMGDFLGTLGGGIVLGIAFALGDAILGSAIAPMFAYLLFVLVLLFRPNGLFGRGVNLHG